MGHSTSQAQKDKGQYVQKPKTVKNIYSKIQFPHVYYLFYYIYTCFGNEHC